MKCVYSIRLDSLRVAVLDTQPIDVDLASMIGPGGFMITRINVPPRYRGRGHGSELLQMVCEDADYEGVSLVLEINPYGDMTYDQLLSWYSRYGFVQLEGCEDEVFVRTPNQG